MGKMKILAGASNLWMKLNLRVAILTSLSLQVFLILFAPIRKRCSSRWIMMLIWSAYLAADLVVDYAFGLIVQAQISSGTSDSEDDAYGDLSAFWAQFLLLHLGGPDTITAFALEDNELWRRHLLNLLFQVGVAGYVIYQSLPSSKLIVPTILIFIGGTIKYIERTRALYLASFSNFRASLLPPPDAEPDYAEFMQKFVLKGAYMSVLEAPFIIPHLGAEDGEILDGRTVVKEAFFYFKTFKGILVDLIFSFHERDDTCRFFWNRTAKDAFKVIEAELNFFYDVFYTKATVVHCPVGYLFRAISVGSIVIAFARFYVLNKHDFHEFDIQITYTLLLGAVGLEFVALVMLICSDWTIAKLGTSEKHCRSLFKGHIFINFLLRFKSGSSNTLHARWSKSICQYNLIDSQLRKWPKWIEKLLGLIHLRELFDDLKFGRVEQYSEELGEHIFKELQQKSDGRSGKEICAARGEWALEHTKTGRDCTNLLPFICDVDYGTSLLLWHIATELCYNIDKSTDDLRRISKVLSDYMLYLMIKQPGMMSTVVGIGQIRFRDSCAETDEYFNKHIVDESKKNITKEYACESVLSVPTEVKPAKVKGDRSKSVLFDACILAKELGKFKETKWVILSEVWMELLAYAAIHCQPYMHAQQLSKGGELVTLVWLLMIHLGLSEHFQIEGGHSRASVLND